MSAAVDTGLMDIDEAGSASVSVEGQEEEEQEISRTEESPLTALMDDDESPEPPVAPNVVRKRGRSFREKNVSAPTADPMSPVHTKPYLWTFEKSGAIVPDMEPASVKFEFSLQPIDCMLPTTRRTWTLSERKAFERGVKHFGRDFRIISELHTLENAIENRTIPPTSQDLVDFYYENKAIVRHCYKVNRKTKMAQRRRRGSL